MLAQRTEKQVTAVNSGKARCGNISYADQMRRAHSGCRRNGIEGPDGCFQVRVRGRRRGGRAPLEASGLEAGAAIRTDIPDAKPGSDVSTEGEG